MIHSLYLGRVSYPDALRLQEELVALRTAGRIGNVLLLLEHPPVLTLGRNAKRSNVLASDELLAARGVTLHEINRGGDVTYHGPGQLIGYPIFDLRSLRNQQHTRLGPVDFVRLMEEALIHLCADYDVLAGRICKLTGVWCGLPADAPAENCDALKGHDFSRAVESLKTTRASAPEGSTQGRKIAAIGIHVARGVTSHGFAFNVTTDLRDFSLINPCGITDRPVTSLEREVRDPKSLPTLESIAQQAAFHFGHVLQQPIEFVESLAALRALAQPAPPAEPAPEFPAEDTPLTVPPEIEHLRHTKDRPVSA
jgi:lipoyl(octanoyl) transferase